eukprot:scpid81854/ scgid35324/ 
MAQQPQQTLVLWIVGGVSVLAGVIFFSIGIATDLTYMISVGVLVGIAGVVVSLVGCRVRHNSYYNMLSAGPHVSVTTVQSQPGGGQSSVVMTPGATIATATPQVVAAPQPYAAPVVAQPVAMQPQPVPMAQPHPVAIGQPEPYAVDQHVGAYPPNLDGDRQPPTVPIHPSAPVGEHYPPQEGYDSSHYPAGYPAQDPPSYDSCAQ